MYQRFVADSTYCNSGILPVRVKNIFIIHGLLDCCLQIWYAISNQTGGGTSMEEQQNPLTYEIIKAVVAGEQ